MYLFLWAETLAPRTTAYSVSPGLIVPQGRGLRRPIKDIRITSFALLLKNLPLITKMLSRIASRSYSVTTREAPGNLSKLTVVVKDAGSKTGKSGISHLLAKYNFLNTEAKSGLRFTRESELLGGIVSSTVTRDSLVLSTQFLKQDLPYFVEALGNVLSKTSFRPHELPETVLPAALDEYSSANSSNLTKALEKLHQISFKKGYGNPLYYDGEISISANDIKEFASSVYVLDNIDFYGSGIVESDLKGFIDELNLQALPKTASVKPPAVQVYQGKEARIRTHGVSVATIGIPIKPSDFAKFDVLSATIGSSIVPNVNSSLAKVGATSEVLKYRDAGLFVINATGDAPAVSEAIKKAKSIVDAVKTTDLTKSVKNAQLAAALQSSFEVPLEYTIDSSAAKPAKLTDFNYVAVGDIDILPFADEL